MRPLTPEGGVDFKAHKGPTAQLQYGVIGKRNDNPTMPEEVHWRGKIDKVVRPTDLLILTT